MADGPHSPQLAKTRNQDGASHSKNADPDADLTAIELGAAQSADFHTAAAAPAAIASLTGYIQHKDELAQVSDLDEANPDAPGAQSQEGEASVPSEPAAVPTGPPTSTPVSDAVPHGSSFDGNSSAAATEHAPEPLAKLNDADVPSAQPSVVNDVASRASANVAPHGAVPPLENDVPVSDEAEATLADEPVSVDPSPAASDGMNSADVPSTEGSSDTAPSDPVPSDPFPSNPAPSGPDQDTHDVAPSNPAPSDPAPSDPAPSGTDPDITGTAPSDPAPSVPTPDGPVPSDPAPSDQNAGPSDMVVGGNPGLALHATSDTETVVLGRVNSDGIRSSVDHWSIEHGGGDLVIDAQTDSGTGGGPDANMWLFRVEEDGSLTQVGHSNNEANGANGNANTYLSEPDLAEGSYVLAIGGFPMSSVQATNTGSDYPNTTAQFEGVYQLTLAGASDVTFATNPDTGGPWGDLTGDASIVSATGGKLSEGIVANVAEVSDADADGIHTFSLSDDANGTFAIDAASGVISVTGDVSDGSQNTIRVVATDEAGASYEEVLGLSFGSNGANDLTGTADNDVLYGFGATDVMSGGTGDDTLLGGAGNDHMSGGDGGDSFVVASMSGNDTVDGGAGWTDMIELAGLSGDVTVSGNVVEGEGWTLVLDGDHSVTGQTLDSIELTADAIGTITFDEGGIIDFSGIDRITM